jgi:hypothetical protein
MRRIVIGCAVLSGLFLLKILGSVGEHAPPKPLTAAEQAKQQHTKLIEDCANGLRVLDGMRKRLARPITDGGVTEYFAICEFDGGRYAEQLAHPKTDAEVEANFRLARSIGDRVSGRGL